MTWLDIYFVQRNNNNTIKWQKNLNRNFSLSKTKSYISIPKLCINNVDITDQKLICNSMNNYFCSVSSNLAAKIKNSQNEFQNYMSKQIPTSMVCETVTRSESINIVSAFRDNKSPGLFGLRFAVTCWSNHSLTERLWLLLLFWS